MLLCEIPETDRTWALNPDELNATTDRSAISSAPALALISTASAATAWDFLTTHRLHTLIDRHVAGGKPLLVVGPAAGLFFSRVAPGEGESFEPFAHWPGTYEQGSPVRGTIEWSQTPQLGDVLGAELAGRVAGAEVELPDGGAVGTWSWPDGSHPGLKPPSVWMGDLGGRALVGVVRNWRLTAVPLWPSDPTVRRSIIQTWQQRCAS